MCLTLGSERVNTYRHEEIALKINPGLEGHRGSQSHERLGVSDKGFTHVWTCPEPLVTGQSALTSQESRPPTKQGSLTGCRWAWGRCGMEREQEQEQPGSTLLPARTPDDRDRRLPGRAEEGNQSIDDLKTESAFELQERLEAREGQGKVFPQDLGAGGSVFKSRKYGLIRWLSIMTRL